MKKLFSEIPYIKSERLVLRKIKDTDAEGLAELAQSPNVYRYLPTFLFEQKYEDVHCVIRRLYDECFKESIILGVFMENSFCGLAEIYGYREETHKASIGCRFLERCWGKGIATETVGALVRYLTQETDIEIVTASTMVANRTISRVTEKNGFLLIASGVGEDWGYAQPVLVNKWVWQLLIGFIRRQGIMMKVLSGVIALALFVFVLFPGGAEAGTVKNTLNLLLNKGVMTVGDDIPAEDITQFYYTRSSSTNPPYYQRYRFYVEDGAHWFYHEKREGRHWPLTEADITASGSVKLSDEQWTAFFDLVKGGRVGKRKEHLESGSSGPWLFLYWNGDRSKYQEFSFPSWGARKSFEEYCVRLKNSQ